MKIMERKYICANGVIERTRYPVGDNAQPRGRRKKGNTGARKQEANFRSAVKQLARTLNCNCDEKGLMITLTYSDEGLKELLKNGTEPEAVRAEADRQMMLWLRRVRRTVNVKFFAAVTSDMDGDTGEEKRVHSHVVLMAENVSMDKLARLWKLGNVDLKHLSRQKDKTKLAVYMLRQVRREADKKKYHVSRGAEKPRTEEREVLLNAPIKAPAGATVLERSEYSEETVVQYIRYLPKKRERHGGHRKEETHEE